MKTALHPFYARLLFVGLAGSILADPATAGTTVPDDPGCYAGPCLDAVTPVPREVRYSEDWLALWKREGDAAAACLVVGANAPPAVRLAADEFSNRCRLLARQAWRADRAGTHSGLPIVPDLRAAARYPVAIILCTAGDKVGCALPERVGTEGYRITHRQAETQVQVVCCGRDARGTYYGAQSLQQLCGVRGSAVMLRLAAITDWPAYRIRCTGTDGSIPADPALCLRAITWLPRFKFNAWAVGESYVWPDNWRKIPKDRMEALENACRLAKANGTLDVVFQVHPFRGRPRDKQYNMVISNPKDVETFIGLCDRMLGAGARGILFRADDYHPLSPQDKTRFGGKAEAHLYLIREVHRRLKAKYPDYYLIFCPPYYQGHTARSKSENVEYMRKLGKGAPPDVQIMWTGAVTRSLEITKQDVADYKELIGRDPFLWDNTVYAHRSRFGYDSRHPGYLFDRFETKYPTDYAETCPGIRYNWGYSDGAVSKVANVTIADYLWNPAGYVPATGLRGALAAVYTPTAVDDLIAFRDAYYAIKDAVDAGRSADPDAFETMAKAAGALPEILARLSKVGLPADRIAELRRRSEGVLSTFRRLEPMMKTARDIRRNALVRFRFDDDTWRTRTRGKWTVETPGSSVRISFPWGTPSVPGAFGELRKSIAVPTSPTGKYYLVFSVVDDYSKAGTPPNAWPGYLRKQVMIGDKAVWDDDVEGAEPPLQQALQVVDVTRYVEPGKPLPVTFRGIDLQGVHNMGATIRFSGACITAGPCSIRAMSVEVPDCPGVRPSDAFSILVRFTPCGIGKRELLYAKNPPYQYFGYQHESGHVVAGVYANRKEISLSSKDKVVPGQVNTLLFVFDHGTLHLFLNARDQGRAQAAGALAEGNGPLRIGAYTAAGPYYDGMIQEFKVFRTAVAPELAERAEGADGELGGWWKLDDRNMPSARDLAGACPDGVVYRIWETQTPATASSGGNRK